MELGDKITQWMFMIGAAMIGLGLIGNVIVFVLKVCGGFNG